MFGGHASRPIAVAFGVTFNEDKSQVRTHNAPAVLAALRDLIRSALKLAGYINTAAGRRAHTERPRVLALYGIT